MEVSWLDVCIAVFLSAVAWFFIPFSKFYHTWNGFQAQLPKGVRSFSEIPGPKGLPWFGSVIRHIINAKSIHLVANQKKMFEHYGPIFKETVMGKTHVYIQSPTDLEAVFKAEGKYPKRSTDVMITLKEYFPTRNIAVVPILALRDDEEWNRLHKAMLPNLLRPKDFGQNIQSWSKMTRDAIKHMIKIRGSAGLEYEIPDLENILYHFAAEGMGIVTFYTRIGLFDDPPNSEAVKLVKVVKDSFNLMGNFNGGLELFLLKYTRYKSPTFKTLCSLLDDIIKTCYKFVDQTTKKHQETTDETEDDQVVPLLTYLLTRTELQKEEAILSSILIFRTGIEVSGTIALWLLYELARHPRAQEKVYKEVSSLIRPDEDFSTENSGKLEYTRACVKETLRLYPDPKFWSRVLSRDEVLSGYHVPAGTAVRYSNFLSGHSEKLFSNPEEFQPERWLNTGNRDIHPYASIPFGIGRRMCIGRRIAQTQLCLLTAKIVQHFILDFHEKPIEITSEFVLIPDRAMRIKFIDRK